MRPESIVRQSSPLSPTCCWRKTRSPRWLGVTVPLIRTRWLVSAPAGGLSTDTSACTRSNTVRLWTPLAAVTNQLRFVMTTPGARLNE
jgi:hypothetical protein